MKTLEEINPAKLERFRRLNKITTTLIRATGTWEARSRQPMGSERAETREGAIIKLGKRFNFYGWKEVAG